GEFSGGTGGDEESKLYDAAMLAIDAGKISTSLLQRRLSIGYGRAAKIIDTLEEMGVVGPADGNKPRKILMTKEDFAELMNNQ
ncbi:MAG: cell division protein FtsK, partial [Ruminococcaceae bacterium]|nr:cell division protein FtsK [Oscillospiraceae bacterium]